MPFSKVQIISFAIAKLGHKPIQSLDNQSDLVNSAEQAYEILLPIIISEHQWRFSCKIAQVTQLVDEPIVDNWTYIYQLPADYLKMIRQYPHNYSFEIYEDSKMYSNINNPLYIEYQYMPTVFKLPAYFVNYIACAIAEHLALSTAHNVQYAQKLANDMETARVQALAADAQNRPQQPLVSQPIITNRSVNSFYYNGITYG